MKKLLLASLAALATATAVPALAADMPVKSAPFAARFSWTGCFVGGHIGGAFAQKDITDPVQLVQDSFLGAGTTTGSRL
jgi:outer membrane immunogenic protein